MNIPEKNINKSNFFHCILKIFERSDDKNKKSLLKTVENSHFKGLFLLFPLKNSIKSIGFKQILLSFYLFYGEKLIFFVFLASFLNQIAVLRF